LFTTVGTTRSENCVLKHIFAFEEKPGFHALYQTDPAERRIHVLSDMRKEWPLVFINNLL
jgi:hypothetical protein